jgi:RimJ/RimL family protein N-acetyltransferase
VGNVVLDKTDTYLGTSRLSVYVGESQARGRGVGLTGIYLALLDGFERYDLHKVWLTVHIHNQSAVRTYRKLQFKVEGVLRDEFWLEGRRIDAYYMGLLRKEFQELLETGMSQAASAI